MSINPRDLAKAYIEVATVDHYLVQVVPQYTAEELDAAEQILIHRDNKLGNKNPIYNLALDLIEHDRKNVKEPAYQSSFSADDYDHIAELMERAIDDENNAEQIPSQDAANVARHQLRAVMSNNTSIILAALRIAKDHANG